MRFRKTIVILNVLSLLPVCGRCELCNVGPANCHQLPLFCLMGYYFSGTVSQINTFFCKVVLVMGFYHINGKATRMSHRWKMQILVETFGVNQMGQQGGINWWRRHGRSCGNRKERAVMSTLNLTMQSEVVHNAIPRGELSFIANLHTSNEFG